MPTTDAYADVNVVAVVVVIDAYAVAAADSLLSPFLMPTLILVLLLLPIICCRSCLCPR